MKIYTKTGDNGTSGLIGGTRVKKNDMRLEAYGTIDELNSNIGMLVSMEIPNEEKDFLKTIQQNLFSIGSYLATDKSKTEIKSVSILNSDEITAVEQKIDEYNTQLPELKNFILPGSNIEASQSHICRTVTRRAERRIIDIQETFEVDENIVKYVNRLSDFFFVLARYLNAKKGNEEIFWK